MGFKHRSDKMRFVVGKMSHGGYRGLAGRLSGSWQIWSLESPEQTFY